jgi:hypothetical protein
MKKYLEVWVGSRGCIENVEEKEFENIEEYLKGESDRVLKDMKEEGGYEDWEYEMYEWNKVGDGYSLGMGDENEMFYIDMECENFKKFVEKELNEELNGETFWSWKDLVENKVWDLINSCNLYL